MKKLTQLKCDFLRGLLFWLLPALMLAALTYLIIMARFSSDIDARKDLEAEQAATKLYEASFG